MQSEDGAKECCASGNGSYSATIYDKFPESTNFIRDLVTASPVVAEHEFHLGQSNHQRMVSELAQSIPSA